MEKLIRGTAGVAWGRDDETAKPASEASATAATIDPNVPAVVRVDALAGSLRDAALLARRHVGACRRLRAVSPRSSGFFARHVATMRSRIGAASGCRLNSSGGSCWRMVPITA